MTGSVQCCGKRSSVAPELLTRVKLNSRTSYCILCFVYVTGTFHFQEQLVIPNLT